jgi:hypothetical protein
MRLGNMCGLRGSDGVNAQRFQNNPKQKLNCDLIIHVNQKVILIEARCGDGAGGEFAV